MDLHNILLHLAYFMLQHVSWWETVI